MLYCLHRQIPYGTGCGACQGAAECGKPRVGAEWTWRQQDPVRKDVAGLPPQLLAAETGSCGAVGWVVDDDVVVDNDDDDDDDDDDNDDDDDDNDVDVYVINDNIVVINDNIGNHVLKTQYYLLKTIDMCCNFLLVLFQVMRDAKMSGLRTTWWREEGW